MSAHSERAHAKLSPSASHRWMHCPGSIRMSEGIPSTSSIFADEGTAAHELAAYCLTNGYAADRFDDWFVNIEAKTDATRFQKARPDGDRVFEVDEEMVDSVQVYLDYIRSIKGPADEMDVEYRFDLQHVSEGMFGTGDCVLYAPSTGTLTVIDFKYGRGVLVDPDDNPQLLTYALGAVARHGNRALNDVVLVVIQPRCAGGGSSDGLPRGVRTWVSNALDLMEFETKLREAALATQVPDAPLAAGEWCKFCPAAAICKVNAKHASDIAGLEFASDGTPPDTMDVEQLSDALEKVTIVESWCNRVRGYAHDQAIAGVAIPGWKLVGKRATRKWRDEGEAVAALQIEFGLSEDDIYERKLNSPVEMEKKVPGRNKEARAAAISGLVTKQSSGAVLVPASDKRPPIKSDGSEFGADSAA